MACAIAWAMQASRAMSTLRATLINSGSNMFTSLGTGRRLENGTYQQLPGRNSYSAKSMDKCAGRVWIIGRSTYGALWNARLHRGGTRPYVDAPRLQTAS